MGLQIFNEYFWIEIKIFWNNYYLALRKFLREN